MSGARPIRARARPQRLRRPRRCPDDARDRRLEVQRLNANRNKACGPQRFDDLLRGGSSCFGRRSRGPRLGGDRDESPDAPQASEHSLVCPKDDIVACPNFWATVRGAYLGLIPPRHIPEPTAPPRAGRVSRSNSTSALRPILSRCLGSHRLLMRGADCGRNEQRCILDSILSRCQ